MEVKLDSTKLIQLVLGFLSSSGLQQTLVCLESESGISLSKTTLPEIAFLRQMVLRGLWSGVEEYMRILCGQEVLKEEERCVYLVRKQRFLETQCIHPLLKSIQIEVGQFNNELARQYQQLRESASNAEDFKDLQTLSEPLDCSNFSALKSRLACFEQISLFLSDEYKVGLVEDSNPCTLTQLISKGLLFDECCRFCRRNEPAQFKKELTLDDAFNGLAHLDLVDYLKGESGNRKKGKILVKTVGGKKMG